MLGALTDLGSTFTRWRTWFLMGNQDIQMRYRRSVLGPFWISMSLVALVVGLAVLYGQIFEQDFADYLSWLGPSFLAWFFFNAMINEGCAVAIDSESHLRGIRIPLPVLVARMVHRNFVIFLHNLAVVICLQALLGKGLRWEILYLPAGVFVLLLVGFFGGLLLAPLCLRFRDISQIIANLTQIAFFVTPIIWMPGQGRVSSEAVDLNPVYHLVELIRAPLIGAAPTEVNWGVSLAVLAALFLLATFALSRSRGKIFTWL